MNRYLHERHQRLWALSNIWRELGPIQYWRLLGSIWIDSENICQDGQVARRAAKGIVHRNGHTVDY